MNQKSEWCEVTVRSATEDGSACEVTSASSLSFFVNILLAFRLDRRFSRDVIFFSKATFLRAKDCTFQISDMLLSAVAVHCAKTGANGEKEGG